MVLLSSVRLMAALGGKIVKGTLKERRLVNEGEAFFEAKVGVEVVVRICRERQNRKTEEVRKRTRIAILGGRIVANDA